MVVQSRASGGAVLAIVAVLFVALFFVVTASDSGLLRPQLLGCGLAITLISMLWLASHVRKLRRTRSVMNLVRSAWL
ncbi:exported protein of unknown function (plasmid) [Cupriavidus taiwanensis]|uniref:Transmembrane protein n=1 Tax=Cupriavidus taiwanensis TaxID=164546 RepID=A0A375FF00_9BURK|nr:hypothetical protein [Cupriavidus taiwanensis]SOZ72639.1 exported hypothetical protein [Cupriavidus taiwanensis]SOZ73300.1 exported hypothetical protein [Cupriavidus taiwanensis]SOZ75202.1 exported hypothetical protein [Cupriavidus taiwanensis]SPA03690.1 exported protein of unknown function [Cupriavidus taiwanensis]SPA11592.1 exported protein of unknown function [Cupriavidus taiwanensis]